VFTGGRSLWEQKRLRHPSVHCFPSSVDVPHFASAREMAPELGPEMKREPADQAGIPHPRLGFFGVIDERMDLALLDSVARARPDWQLVMIGPVVKIDPAHLPKRPNIHWLGGKSYRELPRYIAGWDVALLPFAQNDATRYISPTKTPEYLAAGKPVVSTPITDVVRPYGEMGLAHIAQTPAEFVAAVERALCEDHVSRQRLADGWLSHLSWDRTWSRMHGLIQEVIAQRAPEPQQQQEDRPRGASIQSMGLGLNPSESAAALDAGA
jgi:UDP-galactopyranose mutase